MPADSLVSQAIGRMPSAMQAQALEVLHLSAAGWGPVEIGSRMAMTWGQVNETKRMTGDALVQVLVEDNGYTPVEAIRLLRVPTHIVTGALGDSGERNS